MGQRKTIGIQVIVDNNDKEQINKIIQALREADNDLLLEYANHSSTVCVRKYVTTDSNSDENDINSKTKESLKKILDTLLSMDKHIKFKPLWY